MYQLFFQFVFGRHAEALGDVRRPLFKKGPNRCQNRISSNARFECVAASASCHIDGGPIVPPPFEGRSRWKGTPFDFAVHENVRGRSGNVHHAFLDVKRPRARVEILSAICLADASGERVIFGAIGSV
jgi:hypothetical protein